MSTRQLYQLLLTGPEVVADPYKGPRVKVGYYPHKNRLQEPDVTVSNFVDFLFNHARHAIVQQTAID